jgi:protein-S-isoprenylcysteine O-methyltransferase Ste14
VDEISRSSEELGAELPYAHLLHAVMPILFSVIWGLDSFVYEFSTVLAAFIPLLVRLGLAGVSLGMAFLLMWLSHKTLFHEIRDPPKVLDTGVFAFVRHPMYVGVLLIYVGFIFSTLSLISSAVFVGVFFVYDRMATYEEKDLMRMFGEAYSDYQRRVPKWFPRVKLTKKQKLE